MKTGLDQDLGTDNFKIVTTRRVTIDNSKRATARRATIDNPKHVTVRATTIDNSKHVTALPTTIDNSKLATNSHNAIAGTRPRARCSAKIGAARIEMAAACILNTPTANTRILSKPFDDF